MPDRRTDEDSTVTMEYAIFLAETRGLASGLAHLELCKIDTRILLRAMKNRQARRTHDRRRGPRN